jgi:hypothetical protein
MVEKIVACYLRKSPQEANYPEWKSAYIGKWSEQPLSIEKTVAGEIPNGTVRLKDVMYFESIPAVSVPNSDHIIKYLSGSEYKQKENLIYPLQILSVSDITDVVEMTNELSVPDEQDHMEDSDIEEFILDDKP